MYLYTYCIRICMLEAMNLLTAAWECALQETLLNCFKKAGISSEIKVPSQSDDDDTL